MINKQLLSTSYDWLKLGVESGVFSSLPHFEYVVYALVLFEVFKYVVQVFEKKSFSTKG